MKGLSHKSYDILKHIHECEWIDCALPLRRSWQCLRLLSPFSIALPIWWAVDRSNNIFTYIRIPPSPICSHSLTHPPTQCSVGPHWLHDVLKISNGSSSKSHHVSHWLMITACLWMSQNHMHLSTCTVSTSLTDLFIQIPSWILSGK